MEQTEPRVAMAVLKYLKKQGCTLKSFMNKANFEEFTDVHAQKIVADDVAVILDGGESRAVTVDEAKAMDWIFDREG